jgi:glutamate formiminotransferase/formiminotetrahydrofolate cyclodeaminase
MEKIIECVPNISEGTNLKTIHTITQEIKATKDVYLLHTDPGKDTHRTVITFAGTSKGILEAGFKMIKKSIELIDMSKQQGIHPRMGAVDVFPIIPLKGVSKEECIKLAHQLGKRVGCELNVPIYLYGEAASTPDRMKLPNLRKGGYEALPTKLKDPQFQPDYGPAIFSPKSGALVIGVRGIMIAYNINLDTTDIKIANKIAGYIRESGWIKKEMNGTKKKIPGELKFCQAKGWYLPEYGYAQITTNLHNYEITGLHHTFEAVKKHAQELGVRVRGSEIIGLVPLKSLLDSGCFYSTADKSENDFINSAIQNLGLDDSSPFIPNKRIIEKLIP